MPLISPTTPQQCGLVRSLYCYCYFCQFSLFVRATLWVFLKITYSHISAKVPLTGLLDLERIERLAAMRFPIPRPSHKGECQ